MAINDKIDFETAKALISEYRKTKEKGDRLWTLDMEYF